MKRYGGFFVFLAFAAAVNAGLRSDETGTRGAAVLVTPSVEWLLILSVLVLTAFAGIRWKRIPRFFSALVFVLILFAGADALMLREFDRPVHLSADALLLLNLNDLLTDLLGAAGAAGAWLALTGGLLGVLSLISWGMIRLHRLLLENRSARFTALGLITAVMVSAAGVQQWRGDRYWKFFHGKTLSRRFATALGRTFRPSVALSEGIRQRRRDEELSSLSFAPELAGFRDVLVFFIESYGETVFRDPAHFAAVRSDYGEAEERLNGAGYSVASTVMESPVFGGLSWLAYGSFSCGRRISYQYQWDVLLRTKGACLGAFMRDAGYRTFVAQPGVRNREKGLGVFGFQHEYFLPDFDYYGPGLGWSPVPDQLVIKSLHDRELGRPGGEPRFGLFFLTNTHFPFSKVPGFLDNWASLTDPVVQAGLPVKEFPENSVFSIPRGTEGYLEGLRLDLKVITDYLVRLSRRPSLIIVLGDHQPKREISGPGASSRVPVHFITKDAWALERLSRSFKLTDGFDPGETGPGPGVEEFLPRFLHAFSDSPSGLATH